MQGPGQTGYEGERKCAAAIGAPAPAPPSPPAAAACPLDERTAVLHLAQPCEQLVTHNTATVPAIGCTNSTAFLELCCSSGKHMLCTLERKQEVAAAGSVHVTARENGGNH